MIAQSDIPEQQERDARNICAALRQVMTNCRMSSIRLGALTNTPEASVRRMTATQEPRPSFIAAAERVMEVPLGTIYRLAELIEVDKDIETLLASDEKLHRVFQKTAVATYRHWVYLSSNPEAFE